MKNELSIEPLREQNEDELLQYLNQDRIHHFYTLYDLKYFREKSIVWVASSKRKVVGYAFEFDKRSVHVRGDAKCASPLLKNVKSTELNFNIEPAHLIAVERYYYIIEPADKTLIDWPASKIRTLLIMKLDKEEFKPIKEYEVVKLNERHRKSVAMLLNIETSTAEEMLQGLAYGVYEGDRLVAFASSRTLEELAVIRGVYTAEDKRGKGYAKSVCSTLTEKLLDQGKTPFLYVSKDNVAALRTYEKLGFAKTKHMYTTFQARRKS